MRVTIDVLNEHIQKKINDFIEKTPNGKIIEYFLRYMTLINIVIYILMIVSVGIIYYFTGKILGPIAIMLFLNIVKSISINLFFVLKRKKYMETILLCLTKIDMKSFLENSEQYIKTGKGSKEFLEIYNYINDILNMYLKNVDPQKNKFFIEKIREISKKYKLVEKEAEEFENLTNLEILPREVLIIKYIKMVNSLDVSIEEELKEVKELLENLEKEKNKKYSDEFLDFLNSVIEDAKKFIEKYK